MDILSSLNALTMSANNSGCISGSTDTIICMIVTLVMVHIELKRRRANSNESHVGSGAFGNTQMATACARFLQRCAPEVVGLVGCLAFAAALRMRGDTTKPVDEQAWAEIKAQWPVLLTADTLLALQTFLRLLVLLSVSIRAYNNGHMNAGDKLVVPLSGETATLWLGAGLARVALAMRSKLYMLDGPLGGMLPVACEVAVLPLLFMFSRSTIRRALPNYALVVAATGYFAFRNRLCLAGNPLTDSLFILAHCLDFLAAFAYLLRTLLIENDGKACISTGFTHLVMPIQQALSTYYFLHAFGSPQELVGAGVPFVVLQIGNIVQLGAYLGALILYLAECGNSLHEADNGMGAGQQAPNLM